MLFMPYWPSTGVNLPTWEPPPYSGIFRRGKGHSPKAFQNRVTKRRNQNKMARASRKAQRRR